MERKTAVNKSSSKKLLKDVRKELNMTQSELAEYLGVARANLNRLENGKNVPEWLLKALKLNGILKQAGYTIEDLFKPPNDS